MQQECAERLALRSRDVAALLTLFDANDQRCAARQPLAATLTFCN
jgi:hypothetical protein